MDAVYIGERSGRPRELTALERVQIEQLACCDPLGLNLELTHWSTRSLTTIARQRLHRPKLAHSTVSLILREADLQPHRSRYWKTPTLDAEFVERASRVLWCYGQVERLYQHDEIILSVDEKPNLQATERTRPTQRLRAGQIERQEFEYIRHGTVNFVAALSVNDGKMHGWCLDANDSEHLCPILAELFNSYRQVRRLHLIWDNGPSHVSETTCRFLRDYQPWLRVLFTPARASWLNQSELLLRSFGERYLKRGEWRSRCALIDHLLGSCDEYNRLFACPVAWTWTRRKMRRWVERQTAGLS
ncbi:MAG: IS630 family transposase [Chloroflexi bacterium]|nr:IS630 family transposase [Chloroflexota bacterium]